MCFAFFFYYLFDLNAKVTLEEKVIEKRLTLEMVAASIDRFIEIDDDWYTYDYATIIAHEMAVIDGLPFTFAAAYDSDYQEISNRAPSYNASPFEPMFYSEFVDSIGTNEHGVIVLPFKPDGEPARDMHVCYRWIPTDSSLSNRYLIVVAISDYSVSTNTSHWVWYGAGALVLVTTVLNFILVASLCHLGTIYDSRSGKDKWRGVKK